MLTSPISKNVLITPSMITNIPPLIIECFLKSLKNGEIMDLASTQQLLSITLLSEVSYPQIMSLRPSAKDSRSTHLNVRVSLVTTETPSMESVLKCKIAPW